MLAFRGDGGTELRSGAIVVEVLRVSVAVRISGSLLGQRNAIRRYTAGSDEDEDSSSSNC